MLKVAVLPTSAIHNADVQIMRNEFVIAKIYAIELLDQLVVDVMMFDGGSHVFNRTRDNKSVTLLKVIVLPASASNIADIRIVSYDMSKDTIIATIQANEVLDLLQVQVTLFDGDSHTFKRSLSQYPEIKDS
jgi:hypothetical protein